MQNVNCSVSNCSYYKNNVCIADRIDIGGLDSFSENETCCGTYMNAEAYHINSCENSQRVCNCVVCSSENCAHNNNKLCDLQTIQIGGDASAQVYTETKCLSFEAK